MTRPGGMASTRSRTWLAKSSTGGGVPSQPARPPPGTVPGSPRAPPPPPPPRPPRHARRRRPAPPPRPGRAARGTPRDGRSVVVEVSALATGSGAGGGSFDLVGAATPATGARGGRVPLTSQYSPSRPWAGTDTPGAATLTERLSLEKPATTP